MERPCLDPTDPECPESAKNKKTLQVHEHFQYPFCQRPAVFTICDSKNGIKQKQTVLKPVVDFYMRIKCLCTLIYSVLKVEVQTTSEQLRALRLLSDENRSSLLYTCGRVGSEFFAQFSVRVSV